MTLPWKPHDWQLEICQLISLWIVRSIRVHGISWDFSQFSFYNTEQFMHINLLTPSGLFTYHQV